MLDFGFYNMDCMEGMKEFPDKYFDLAIVDPPYGDGGGAWTNGERFGQRFDRYRHPQDKQGGVARETEVPSREGITRSERERDTKPIRTGGTWAAKYAKKLLRGMWRLNRNISKSCFASHVTK